MPLVLKRECVILLLLGAVCFAIYGSVSDLTIDEIEEEISYLFSFTPMEIQNFFIFVYGTFFAGITIVALHYQIKKQTKATSTSILLKTLDRVREPDFQDTMRKIFNDKSTECEDIEIRKLLNYLEYIALFENDGVLDMNHIYQMHGAILKKIKTDEHVQKIMKEVIDRDPNYYYTYLRRILEKN